MASAYGHTDAMAVLIEHGADIESANKARPRHQNPRVARPAAPPGRSALAPLVPKPVLPRDPDVCSCARGQAGNTPLHVAGKNGQFESAELLRKHKASLHVKNTVGRPRTSHTPGVPGALLPLSFLHAERPGGAAPPPLSQNGQTPYDLAYANNFIDLMEILKERSELGLAVRRSRVRPGDAPALPPAGPRRPRPRLRNASLRAMRRAASSRRAAGSPQRPASPQSAA